MTGPQLLAAAAATLIVYAAGWLSGWQRADRLHEAGAFDEPESSEDRERRIQLGKELHALNWRQPLEARSLEALRRLALLVVCAWTDDQASNAEFQEKLEQLADHLVRTS